MVLLPFLMLHIYMSIYEFLFRSRKEVVCVCVCFNPSEVVQETASKCHSTWWPSICKKRKKCFLSPCLELGFPPPLLALTPPRSHPAPFLLDFFLCRSGFWMCRLITFNFSFACYRCLSRCSQGNLDRGS